MTCEDCTNVGQTISCKNSKSMAQVVMIIVALVLEVVLVGQWQGYSLYGSCSGIDRDVGSDRVLSLASAVGLTAVVIAEMAVVVVVAVAVTIAMQLAVLVALEWQW